MLKRLEALQKFLQSLNSLRKQGLIKTVDEAVAFAKQEFGEVNDLFKRQIEQVFKGTTPKAPPPGGGGITSIKNAPKKETLDQESGISFSIPERGIIRQNASIEEITDMIKNNPYRPKKGLDPVEGMTRTAARVVLDRYGIKVPERVDPIEAFEENFGGDALMDLKNVGEELLEKETRGKITESMGEFLESRGMFNLKVNKDAPKGMTDDELIKKLTDDVDEAYGVTPDMKRKLNREEVKKEAMEKYGFTEEEFENIMNTEFDEKILDELDGEDILSKFDPKGRKPSAIGGIQRVGYRYGAGKSLIKFLKGKENLIKKIKQAVDDIFTTGDSKYDADVAVDTMFEELGVDRDMFDQKEVLDAYGLAYDELRKPLLEKIKNKPTAFNQQKILDDVDEAYGVTPDMKKELDAMTGMGAPKMAERFELKQRFPGIDDKLLTQIIDDPNPQNKAEAIATLDQAMELTKQGKDPDEIISVLEKIKNSRKDNARGGLQYLMGM